MNRLYRSFWDLARIPTPAVTFTNHSDVLPSALSTSELALGAVACAGSAAAELAHGRGHARPDVVVDGRRTSAAFRSDRLFRLEGRSVDGFAPLSGFWPTADGWARTHANYPHHRDRLLAALELPATAGVPELAHALASRRSHEVEQRVASAGGVCVAVRDQEEWRRHAQAEAVHELPLVAWARTGDAPPRQLPRVPTEPLLPARGLRVLDLTRVIAGPVATRTLALLGADVLRVDSPRLPEIPWQHLDTGMGKRSTLLDLSGAAHRRALDRLVEEADVVVSGYRPGALARFGLDPQRLAARRPGLVIAELTAWGPGGPWSDRRGFDSVVQAASGIALAESTGGGEPGRLPAQALDHATGYLLAAAILVAVARQLREGGTLHVQAHLARTAQWLLAHPAASMEQLPPTSGVVRERRGPAGLLSYTAPAVQISNGPDDWTEVGHIWGADPPSWRTPR